jgi:hypothetical protein
MAKASGRVLKLLPTCCGLFEMALVTRGLSAMTVGLGKAE